MESDRTVVAGGFSGQIGMSEAVRLATQNAADMRAMLAEARGHQVVRRSGFLAVDGRPRTELRIVVLRPDPDPAERAELAELARTRPDGKVTVEDPFDAFDMSDLGMTARTLPVMIRRPGLATPPADPDVVSVERPDQLETAERIMVEGFPLPDFQPHRPAEAFPPALLERSEVGMYLAARGGVVVGACLTITAGSVVGVYWVTTLPEYRSQGVGRSLMHAVLERHPDRPITLTASRSGKPLYDTLAFDTVTQSSWWQ